MVKIIKLVKTCEACPAQWGGRDSEGNPIYIRYRWGILTVRQGEKGKGMDSAVEGKILVRKILDPKGWEGRLSYDELKQALTGQIEMPRTEVTNVKEAKKILEELNSYHFLPIEEIESNESGENHQT